ncbi:hypothetical protein ACJMK2_002227 [Sinanodonta woodiana]|uniref:Uncharacterized protein n=1 Tax=Sinanodonta woodiana TaxID=1069815 RepID=A0ABD3XWX6_SINWO
MPVKKRFPASSDSSFRDDEQPHCGLDSTQRLSSVGSKINDLGHNENKLRKRRDEAGTRDKYGRARDLVTETKRQNTNNKRKHEDVIDRDEDLYRYKKKQHFTDPKCSTNEMRQEVPGHEKEDWTNNSLSQSSPILVNSASNVGSIYSRKNILLNCRMLELPDSSLACQPTQPYSKKSILLNRYHTQQSQLVQRANKTISDEQRNSQNDPCLMSNVDQFKPRQERVTGIFHPSHQLENVYTIWQPSPTLFVPPTALINDQDDTVASSNNVVDRIRYVNVMEEEDRNVMDTMLAIFQTSMMSNEE